MYVFNQAFNLDPTIVANGIKFVVKDSNQDNAVVYETQTYTSSAGMGIVELKVPSSYFRGSVWVMSTLDGSPIDVIAINPPDLGSTSNNSELVNFQLWVVESCGRGATDCYVCIEDTTNNVNCFLRAVGASGYAQFNLDNNKEYLISVYNSKDACVQTRTIKTTSQNLYLTISI